MGKWDNKMKIGTRVTLTKAVCRHDPRPGTVGIVTGFGRWGYVCVQWNDKRYSVYSMQYLASELMML